ncbi:hypothetical protein AB0C02_32535 [Micromonospora sp. NPDC048999]|uniref:hypothetical protein n=1 Tax=Micromonospora sp. NPDC048999 TaxID=3155391 RepID=UPI0034078505
MSAGSGGDVDLTARLCVELPKLAAAADRHRWAHKLDAAIADVRAGTPVTQALAAHHLPIDLAAAHNGQDQISRGDPGLLDELNIDPVTVTGAYTCPGTPPCPRRAQPDADGHEPRCAIQGKTMILRSR